MRNRLYIGGFLLLLLSGCGGGGGGTPTLPATTATGAATPAPPIIPAAGAVGDVKIISPLFAGQLLAYDAEDHLLIYADGPNVYAAQGNNVQNTRWIGQIPSGDSSRYIAGITYSSAQQAIIFASSKTIYRLTLQGAISNIATGFQYILSLTVDNSGSVFVVDNDHVSGIASGSPKVLTPPGSIPSTSSLPTFVVGIPSITYDSQDGGLYVTDPADAVVKRVSKDGTISDVAGNCTIYTQDATSSCWLSNQPGTGANVHFGMLSGITYDASLDEFFIADVWNSEILAMTPSGSVSIAAGYGAPLQLDGNGRYAFLDFPQAVVSAADSGLVYFLEVGSPPLQTLATLATTGAPAPTHTIAQAFWTARVTSGPTRIAATGDGGAWFTETIPSSVGHISGTGVITEYTLPAPYKVYDKIATDSDGNAWVTVSPGFPPSPLYVDSVVRITTGGTETVYPIGGYSGDPANSGVVSGVTLGPDGNMWYSENDSFGGSVGYIDGAGTVHSFRMGTAFLSPIPTAISSGPDGTLWVGVTGKNGAPSTIQRVSTNGQLLTSFMIGDTANVYDMILNRSDNTAWFVDGNSRTGKISATGSVSLFDNPVCGSVGCAVEGLTELAVTPDGAVWSTEENLSDIASFSSAGRPIRYLLPQGQGGFQGIAARRDGKLWVTAYVGAIFLFDPGDYDAARLPHSVARKPQRIGSRQIR